MRIQTQITPQPQSDKRSKLKPRAQRWVVEPGEYVRLTLEPNLTDVVVTYPSGYVETVEFDTFDPHLLRNRFNITEWLDRRLPVGYLVNFKRIAYWPNEKIVKIVMRDPNGNEIFV